MKKLKTFFKDVAATAILSIGFAVVVKIANLCFHKWQGLIPLIIFLAIIMLGRAMLCLRYGVIADAMIAGLENRDIRLWLVGWKKGKIPTRDAYLKSCGSEWAQIFDLTKWRFEDFYPGLMDDWRNAGKPWPITR